METGKVILPMSLIDGHIVSRTTINGIDITLLVDSGSPSTVLSPKLIMEEERKEGTDASSSWIFFGKSIHYSSQISNSFSKVVKAFSISLSISFSFFYNSFTFFSACFIFLTLHSLSTV